MYQDYLKRKERVIITAIELLDECGIQGLTTKEIAKRQGVTEPAIYRQFESKQEIVCTVLERFAAFDEVIMNTITEQNMSPLQGVFYFAEAYAGYYQSYPQIATVLFSFDVYRYNETTNQRMKKILDTRQDFLNELIIKGQEAGEFDSKINSMDIAKIVMGLIWSITFQWKFSNSDENLKDAIINALRWILR